MPRYSPSKPAPYRRLLASIILRAARDAQKGDPEALAFLASDRGREWAGECGVYVDLNRLRAPQDRASRQRGGAGAQRTRS